MFTLLCLLTLKLAAEQRGCVLRRWKHYDDAFFPALVLGSVGLLAPGSGSRGFCCPPAACARSCSPGLGNLLPGRRRSVFVYVECGSSGTHGKNCASHQTLTPACIGLTCSVCTVHFIFNSTRF